VALRDGALSCFYGSRVGSNLFWKPRGHIGCFLGMVSGGRRRYEVKLSWLTKQEAAEYLRVSKGTIDNLESRGMLKGHRLYLIGSRPILRFRQEDLDTLFLKRPKGRPVDYQN